MTQISGCQWRTVAGLRRYAAPEVVPADLVSVVAEKIARVLCQDLEVPFDPLA